MTSSEKKWTHSIENGTTKFTARSRPKGKNDDGTRSSVLPELDLTSPYCFQLPDVNESSDGNLGVNDGLGSMEDLTNQLTPMIKHDLHRQFRRVSMLTDHLRLYHDVLYEVFQFERSNVKNPDCGQSLDVNESSNGNLGVDDGLGSMEGQPTSSKCRDDFPELHSRNSILVDDVVTELDNVDVFMAPAQPNCGRTRILEDTDMTIAEKSEPVDSFGVPFDDDNLSSLDEVEVQVEVKECPEEQASCDIKFDNIYGIFGE